MDAPQEEALFGRWLRRRRKALDLTQKVLARRVGCSAATIRKLEADERHPSRHIAFALAKVLGVPEAERADFVRFARGGWTDRPPEAAPVPDLERPWAVRSQAAPTAGSASSPAAVSAESAASAAVPAAAPASEAAPAPGAAAATAEEAAPAPAAPSPAVPPARSRTAAPEGQESSATASAPRPAVVAREPELRRLAGALEEALAGRGRVTFVAGDAGQGKTTLLRAFAERAQAEHGELLVLTGVCNAYTGSGDPFLPFREVLQQLTGEVPTGPELEALESERAERLAGFAPRACRAVLEGGSQLVGTLLAAELFAERAARAGVSVAPGGSWGHAAQNASLQGVLGGASHGALSAATTRVLTTVAGQRPLLLLLDDLQWLDQSSADLLLHLGRVAAGHRILVLGAYRAADVSAEHGGRRHVMQAVVHEIERTYGDAVLDLDHTDGRAFLEAWLDTEPNTLGAAFREALWHQTGGQPLFTIELLRAMQAQGDLARDDEGRWSTTRALRWDALPQRVAGALAERVGRLGAFEHDVLRLASVEGELFTAEAVARALKRDPREVTAALGAQLDRKHRLVGGVDVRRGANGLLSRYRFRHNLIQRFVYDAIDEGERSYLHEAIADALEALLAHDADPVALAYHYTKAHMPDRAAIHHRRAGDQARKTAALDQAIEHYQAALESWPVGDPGGRASLLRDLGECQWTRGALPNARHSLEEALAWFRAAGDVRAAAAAQLIIARTHYEDGDWDRSLATCREALDLLEQEPESPELAWAQASLAQLYMTAVESYEGLAWGWRALKTAERVKAEHVRAHALNTVGTLLCGLGPDRVEEGLSMLSESFPLSDRLGLTYDACRALYNHGDALRQLSRFEEAEARLAELVDYARNHQVAVLEGVGRFELWRLRWRQGRWSACFAERPQMRRLVEGGPFESALHPVVTVLASADVDVGLVNRAHRALERAEPVLTRLVEPQFRGPYLRERLRIASASGQPDEADAVALEFVESVRGKLYIDTVLLAALTALQWMVGRPSDALQAGAQACLEGLEEAAVRYGSAEASAAAAEARGTFASAAGDPEAAATHLLDAAGHWQDCGFPLDEARARGAAARQLTAGGKDARAAAEAERAKALLAELAAQLPDDETRGSFAGVQRELLDGCGVSPG